MNDATSVLVRVWLPDRPGALGLVASRIGAVDGDIVGIDVLERGESVAVDEFAVQLRNASALDIMVREIEEVDGASVEEVRIVDHFPDPRLDALESAASLCAAESIDELHEILVGQHPRRVPRRLERARDRRVGARRRSGDVAIEAGVLEALAAGTAASPMVADGSTGPDDLARRRAPEARARRCSSAVTAIRSDSASGCSSWRSRASPTARGSCWGTVS